MSIAPPLDLTAVRARQQATWASGDFAEIATLIVPVAERLTDAADLRAGWSVLDVACGSGNAAIAAARLGCVVSGIDYVPALLERGRERAAAETGRARPSAGRRRGDPVCRRVVRRGALGLRVDVRSRPSTRSSGARPRRAARRHDRARELDSRRVHRRDVRDDHRACRRRLPGSPHRCCGEPRTISPSSSEPG